jgi:hypothetical protein
MPCSVFATEMSQVRSGRKVHILILATCVSLLSVHHYMVKRRGILQLGRNCSYPGKMGIVTSSWMYRSALALSPQSSTRGKANMRSARVR